MIKLNIARGNSGFTLIEILVVIGIIALLAAIVIIAINPARQFAQARNTQRSSNVNAILNAIGQYIADNKGAVPAGIPTAPADPLDIASGGANICTLLMPTYIPSLPSDPKAANGGASITDCTTYNSEYQVVKDASGRITVSAPNHIELGVTISVTR